MLTYARLLAIAAAHADVATFWSRPDSAATYGALCAREQAAIAEARAALAWAHVERARRAQEDAPADVRRLP